MGPGPMGPMGAAPLHGHGTPSGVSHAHSLSGSSGLSASAATGTGVSGAGGIASPTVPMAEVNPHHQCRPAYMSLSVGAIPAHKGLLAKAALPFGLAVHPLSEGEGSLGPGGIPVVNFGAAGVIRCKRCRAYINPFSSFVDGGRRWRCNLCAYVNDVPQAYFAPCDAAGQRVDRDSRPELTCGSVEFVATAEYMMRPPQPPVYMFVIDVSYGAVASGVLQTAVDTIRGVSRARAVSAGAWESGVGWGRWLGGWLTGWLGG